MNQNNMRKYYIMYIFFILLIATGCGVKDNKNIENERLKTSVTGYSCAITEENQNTYKPYEESVDYYYSRMNESERKLYNIFVSIAEHFNEDDYVCQITVPAEMYDNKEFTDMYRCVYTGFYRDHPEYYPFSLDAVDEEIVYTYPYLDKENNTYDIQIFQAIKYENYEKESKDLENAATAFLSDIDLSQADYDIARDIHDKLIGNVYYGDLYEGKDNPPFVNYSRCAYGALISSGSKDKYVICTGYSSAYTYLMKKAGLKSTAVTGYSYAMDHNKNEYIGNYHMWNVICIDGKWLDVDCTVDDMGPNDVEISDDQFMEIVENADDKLLAECTHICFCIDKNDMTVRETSFEYTFKNNEKKDLYLGYVHYRDNELEEHNIEMTNRQLFEIPLTKYYP